MAQLAPFMRGRTLNGCLLILDEAQNTTSEQTKCSPTRLGFNSRAVITGDITQIDLPKSGAFQAGGGPSKSSVGSRGLRLSI